MLGLSLLVFLWAPGTAQRRRVKKAPEKTHIEYSLDTVMDRIDDMQETLNTINTFRVKGLDTANMRRELVKMGYTLGLIRNTLDGNMMLEYKRLLLDENMLQDIKTLLGSWRTQLFTYNNNLLKMNAETEAFAKDSVLRNLITDSIYREMYEEEMGDLTRKWVAARQVTMKSLSGVNALQSAITRPYFETVDLLNEVQAVKAQIAGRLFQREYPYLWKSSTVADTSAAVGTASRSLLVEKGLMDYFLRQHWGYYVYAILIGVAFFVWVWRNFRLLDRLPGATDALKEEPLPHLRSLPFKASGVVLLNLLPFFNFNAPSLLTQFGQLLLLVLVSIFFARHWTRRHFMLWLAILFLYLLFVGTGAVLVPRQWARIWLLALNAGSMVVGWYCVRRIARELKYARLMRFVLWVYLVLNGIAVIANALGRLTIAKLAGATAIFALVQVVLLGEFVESVMEAFRLQVMVSRLEKKSAARISLLDRLQKGVFRLLAGVAAITWVAAFSMNLNIYDTVARMFDRVMNHSLKLGSVEFRIGNVLLFVVIIYVSNQVQKYIGFLYGGAEGQGERQSGRRASRLAIIRLVLIIFGFLVAIAASGLPVDRITIVLGALGVGIGLGLQNIVNNLVSGIILIFERPFQIGDYIELNAKKGIVRDIGIRASKLVTEEGTEIIMPNGDLLSGEVINWTVRNNEIRIEIPLTVEAGHTYEELSSIVEEALRDHPGLSQADKPHVLLNTSTEKTMSLTVLAWVERIGQIQTIKSEVLRLLVQKFREKGVKTV